jgi:hypothetical protein
VPCRYDRWLCSGPDVETSGFGRSHYRFRRFDLFRVCDIEQLLPTFRERCPISSSSMCCWALIQASNFCRNMGTTLQLSSFRTVTQIRPTAANGLSLGRTSLDRRVRLAFVRFYILVQVKDVLGIVLLLDVDQPRIVRSVGCSHPIALSSVMKFTYAPEDA